VVFGAGKGFNVYAIVVSIALGALLFYIGEVFPSIQQVLRSAGYLGTFVLGILYSHSFTSLPAAALLLLMARSQNIWLAGMIATLGAVVGDLTVFALFRSAKGFSDEHPNKARYARWWAAIEAKIPLAWQPSVMMAVVAVFLLLPLPNEFADYLLARTRTIKTRAVLLISYVLNGIGIYAILWLGRFG
jgi:membrane protein YqaA with SNARE-associated domain